MNQVIKTLTEKKELSPAEYKKMMSVYFTQKRDRVEHCGHKYHSENQPRNNCPYCWFAYFQINGSTTQIAEECYQKEGQDILVRTKGEKFVKNFLRFMSTLAYMKENKINGFEREVGSDQNSREES